MDGLLPAIVQDAATSQVLMLGYMSRDALTATLDSGFVTFFSRSKNRLWQKGETSGNRLALRSVRADCDDDALLVLANPEGPTCHLGTSSCFGEADAPGPAWLAELERVIQSRAAAPVEESYTARLLASGLPRIAQKVGEEGVETALAAVTADDAELTGEAADLLYHLIVLLHARGLSLEDAIAVLRERHR
jgi:phosphoribosyl-ATP pyrophosphohydrolase/phosphoribosyl-AMP cyclohydrolase